MATRTPTGPSKAKKPAPTAEEQRLEADLLRKAQWKRWGPYLSEGNGARFADHRASGWEEHGFSRVREWARRMRL